MNVSNGKKKNGKKKGKRPNTRVGNLKNQSKAIVKGKFKSLVYGGLRSLPPDSFTERFVTRLGRKKVN